MTDRFRLRLGYNYGRSPVRKDVLFANALSPLMAEHHLGLGFGYDLSERFSVDFGWVHTFTKTLTDDGSGDTFSQGGKGTTASLGIDSLILGVSYKF